MAAPYTAKDIFALFDQEEEGILHVVDMAAGLAVLCDGCISQSTLHTCLRLYGGADRDLGANEIASLITSIFKVCMS